jgi:hypothetical protein
MIEGVQPKNGVLFWWKEVQAEIGIDRGIIRRDVEFA